MVLLVLATSMGIAEPRAVPSVIRVRLGGRYDAGTVQRSLDRARARLEKPGCRRLFTDFQDASGRSLQEALDRAGESGAEHLGTLLFYDGSGQARCRGPRTLAFTWPGSQIVFVCAQQFVEAARHDPFLADAALIHESLHSLGLGENPPRSSEITSRVIARCRR
ncbi:MAG TPA: hypothetical protein VEQ84_04935 [Vicinamibacteria bacterium]|nr:hypothetical protein [Vicinamibacteria bacterium]